MYVKNKTEFVMVSFRELSFGDPFEDDGEVYIKTNAIQEKNHTAEYNSVSLTDGLLHKVEPDKKVYTIKYSFEYEKIATKSEE